MLRPDVLDYYNRGGERTRLAAGTGLLEYLRTWDILERALPAAPADILDVGGATGVYAAPLAAAGHRVHVVDPVPDHVAAAGALPGVTAAVGDARALDVADASVDAVLLFGPLYHLTDRADRVLAWAEARRVLRPGGVVLGATIGRFASLFDGFVKGYAADPLFVGLVRDVLATGVHGGGPYFTTAYFHHPDEPAAEARDAGLAVRRVVCVESALWMAGRLPEVLASPDQRALMLELLRGIEEEPAMLGTSSHLITVAGLLSDS
ncbi:class I SAM-dependent methyltransferase [Longispora sp. NPDC051575]|uniref:class I SAM-dependent methyltransferase n=1 Tax=Longispora sp. NPDC051575 TaxID=3154943 RepID=UPI003443CD55